MKKALIIALLLLMAVPAQAEKIKYYQDPVFQRLNGGDPHPMDDLIALAEDNDIRAQFILGDLYAKGKGGLSRNDKKAAYWFEQSARRGYAPSFLRLAALAKRKKAPVEAYKWYTLAVDQPSSGDDGKYADKARKELAQKAELSKQDLREAKKAANDWKAARVKQDRERKTAKKVEKEDALLKKPDEEKKKKERYGNE